MQNSGHSPKVKTHWRPFSSQDESVKGEPNINLSTFNQTGNTKQKLALLNLNGDRKGGRKQQQQQQLLWTRFLIKAEVLKTLSVSILSFLDSLCPLFDWTIDKQRPR